MKKGRVGQAEVESRIRGKERVSRRSAADRRRGRRGNVWRGGWRRRGRRPVVGKRLGLRVEHTKLGTDGSIDVARELGMVGVKLGAEGAVVGAQLPQLVVQGIKEPAHLVQSWGRGGGGLEGELGKGMVGRHHGVIHGGWRLDKRGEKRAEKRTRGVKTGFRAASKRPEESC